MPNHNFRRFIVFIGLTFTLMLGIFTTPAFAQSGDQQNNSAVTTGLVTIDVAMRVSYGRDHC